MKKRLPSPYGDERSKKKYWLTPPHIFSALDREFRFDFDPCPCPRPRGYDSLHIEWGQSNYVNPPFRADEGYKGGGPSAFVHKAIAEAKKGKTSVLILPVNNYVDLLLRAGAKVRYTGRIRWLDAKTKQAMPGPGATALFILKGKKPVNPNRQGRH